MELWIQPCTACADLCGQSASQSPHAGLTLNKRTAAHDVQTQERYTCTRCNGVFARILTGEPHKQLWILLNASQH